MTGYSRRDTLKGIGAAGTVGMVGLAGCAAQEPAEEGTEESGSSEPISIGSIFPVTGTNSPYGGGHQEAFNQAVQEMNDAGGPLDREVVSINRDTEGKPEQAAQKFRTMINQDGIVGLVGPYSSGIGTVLAPIAADNRVMQMSNGNTSPSLATAGVNDDNGVKYYGRTAPNDVQQALVVARVMNQKIEADSASFLYVDNPYGQGLAEAAAEAFDGEVLSLQAYTQQTNDYTSTLDALFADDPDAVGAVMYPGNGRTIMNQWSQGGYGGEWTFAEAIWSPQLIEDLAEIFQGMYITSPQTADSATFQESLGGKENVTQFAPHAYDGTYLTGLAIQAAGTATGTGIAENIQSVATADDGDVDVGVGEFAAGKNAIAGGSGVNYDGASGSVELNENLEPVVPYRIMQVESGVAELNEEVPLSFFEGKI
jgi:branched-chain amino acid transport system substrate-binding protein